KSRGSLRTAIRGGFSNAWSAIIDSNITTLLAAALLFFLASGPVRGFGVTLSIDVAVSMFTALVLTRVLVDAFGAQRWFRNRPKWTGLGYIGWVRRILERRNPDVMGRRKIWLTISAVAVVLAIIGIGVRWLNFGVECTGGRLVEYNVSKQISVDKAR